jgi:hypothetical protein
MATALRQNSLSRLYLASLLIDRVIGSCGAITF